MQVLDDKNMTDNGSLKNSCSPKGVDIWDRYLVLGALFVGYLFSLIFFPPFHLTRAGGYWISLFFMGFIALCLKYLYKKNGNLSKETLFYSMGLGVIALSFGLYADNSVGGLVFLYLLTGLPYLVLIAGKVRIDNGKSYFLLDMINGFFLVPLSNIGVIKQVSWCRVNKYRGESKLKEIAVGLIISIPLLAVVLALLNSADPQFESLVKHFFCGLKPDVTILEKAVLALIVGVYYFGLLYGVANHRGVDTFKKEKLDTFSQNLKILANLSGAVVLIVLCGVYLLYLGVQAMGLSNVLSGIYPVGFNASEFARRGFFELCAIVIINMSVLYFNKAFVKNSKKLGSVLEVAVCILTLLLIALALCKMGVYIYLHGLTQLRVFTSWFMLFMALVFIVWLINVFKPFSIFKWICGIFLMMVIILSHMQIDRLVVTYNINAYKNSTLQELDMNVISTGGIVSIKPLQDLYPSITDPALKARVQEYLTYMKQTNEYYGYLAPSNLQELISEDIY